MALSADAIFDLVCKDTNIDVQELLKNTPCDPNDYQTGYEMNQLDPDSDYCKGLPDNVRRLLSCKYSKQGSNRWLLDRKIQFVVSGTTAYDISVRKVNELTKTHMAWKRPFVGNADTQRGHENESVAITKLATKIGKRIFELGTVQHPSIPYIGVSPDGITEDGMVVEIKCPRKINATIKPGYAIQVQMELKACESTYAYFVQYQTPKYALMLDENGDKICIEPEVLDIRTINITPGWFEDQLPLFEQYHNKLMELRRTDREWLARDIAWTKYAKGELIEQPDIVTRFLSGNIQMDGIELVLPSEESPGGLVMERKKYKRTWSKQQDAACDDVAELDSPKRPKLVEKLEMTISNDDLILMGGDD